MKPKERTNKLREVSGTVTYSDPLTSLFYQLMRDEIPAGTLERVVQDVLNEEKECVFTNGWLAKYANNLAEEIKNANVSKMANTLSAAFNDSKKLEIDGAVDFSKDDLDKIEEEIIQATKGDVSNDKDLQTVLDYAKDTVQDLVNQGVLTKEQADVLKLDMEKEVAEIKEDSEE